MLTFDTRNGVEQVVVNAALGLGVSGGLTLTTGGITFSANLAQITLADNQATALQIGASGTLGIISVKTTNGAESVTFGGVGIVLPERTLDIPSAASPASNGVVAVALSVAINFPGGVNTTSITLPTRTNGWLVRDAYVRSEGATGGTATIQNTGSLDITDAMIPGNANAITRAAAINNVNASIASASALRVTTIAGTPAGMAFVTLQGL